MNSAERRILVLYRTLEYPLRATLADHLFAFRRYASADCLYLNVAAQPVPRALARESFDLVIFHTTLLSSRVRPERFRRLINSLQPFSESSSVRVALPQDEFVYTDVLAEFIERVGVDYVFSVAPEETWPVIYRGIDPGKVALHQILTGYLEPQTLKRIDRLAASAPRERPIDVGYRAHGVRFGLGRHGYMKIQIADAFRAAAGTCRLRTDISTRFEDTFLGDSWYRFLLRCRFVLGMEGGASLHDPDGQIGCRVREYLAQHPNASFEDVEEACFSGMDGAFPLYALSPRHLEACATRTGQLLVEGDYDGVLEAGTHFISIGKDLGNLDEIAAAVSDESARQKMTEQAYDDVVRSGKYTYERFVEFVLETSLSGRHTQTGSRRRGRALRARVRLRGLFGWLIPVGIGVGARALHVFARRGPAPLGRFLRRIEKRVRGK